jgi:hypothetical protein
MLRPPFLLRAFFFTLFFSSLASSISHASETPYIDAGTSAGSLKHGDAFFGQSGANSSGLGFVGSMSIYEPVTSTRNVTHLEIGLQNRLTLVSTANAAPNNSLAMFSPNLAARIEFWRFYAGAGYAPLSFISKPGGGASSLHTNPGASSYFFEGGAIWKIVPEFQVAATIALEEGLPSGGGTAATATEYGIRFRFPLSPHEGLRKGDSVDYDGRYPFGFMR